MDDVLTVDRVSELTDAQATEVRVLTAAVYPPDQMAAWRGKDVEWASPEWCVRVGEACELVSYIGVYLRQALMDGKPQLVGGIGNVKTHPAARRRGFARQGIRRATEFFAAQGAAFALLVCEPSLVAYYSSLGWMPFAGRLLVRQHGTACEFTFNPAMLLAVHSAAPTTGTIDLCGPPW